MKEPKAPDEAGVLTAGQRVRRALFYVFICLALFILLGPILAPPVEIGITLIAGWWSFLSRTVPRIHWNWDLLGMALFCLGVILFLGHWVLNRLLQLAQSAHHPERPTWRWPWKWTWCGLSAALLFFFVGMSVGGIVHQLGWILSSPEPLMEAKRWYGMDYNNIRQLDGAWQQASLDGEGDIGRIRQLVWEKNGMLRGDSGADLRQKYHLLLISGEDGKIAGAVIVPRDSKARSKVGCYYSFGDKSDFEPESKLKEILERHRKQFIAL
ncbi:MAG: hypothetical protein EPO07_02780 [Verrucomicrobia bacterium]|nr:MAG: hypothetical protein EPO07_02780 [Verrucomicrobiota bacterium]